MGMINTELKQGNIR